MGLQRVRHDLVTKQQQNLKNHTERKSKLWTYLKKKKKINCESVSCVQFFATPRSLPGSSIHGISQARVLEWVAIPSSSGSSQPRDWTQVSCIACRFFTVWVIREACGHHLGEDKICNMGILLVFPQVPNGSCSSVCMYREEKPGRAWLSSSRHHRAVLGESKGPWPGSAWYFWAPSAAGNSSQTPSGLGDIEDLRRFCCYPIHTLPISLWKLLTVNTPFSFSSLLLLRYN